MKHADENDLDEQGMSELRRLYVQAPGEEPPAALDAAILARARSAVAVSASRSSAARWRAPLATAAVLVLSVIVVNNVQREQPEVLSVTAPAPQGPVALQDDAGKAPQAKSSDAASAAVELSLAPAPAPVPVPVPEEVRDRVASSELASRAQGSAQSETSREVPAPASPVSQAAPRLSLRADNARSEAGPLSAAVTAAKSTDNMTAEQWLAHLVELKAQGRLQEFQDSLAEFRKRHPGYRIPESLTLGPAEGK